MEERFYQTENKPKSDTIVKSNIATFAKKGIKVKSNDQSNIQSLEADGKMFANLYISMQTRKGNIAEFFKHENNTHTPSLTQNRKITKSTKSTKAHNYNCCLMLMQKYMMDQHLFKCYLQKLAKTLINKQMRFFGNF